ncbi:MAG: hypothetical protein EHM83_10365 [Burkholderiales bacterium]|nr:MAG: hypothetical protein EHM83_10365 [Burkholderiales bacterium]
MQNDAGRRPLSLAKLTAPQPNRAWPRRRLFDCLDAARRSGNIVWIAAPAGSGKTTLVASYLQARRLRAVWYRVDPADGDAASFFHYLGLAAKGSPGRRDEALPAFAAEYLEGLPVFARNWFRRFYERMKGFPLLVFDDYHQVAADSPVHVAVREALAEVPPGLTVIVASRAEPPPLLTRLRTLDTFTLLDRDALRLTADESAGVARQRLADSTPDDAALRTLHERTQGWLAGLVLMLERGPAAPAADVTTPGDPLVFDYFAGELLAQSEPRLQRFLVTTALLPRVTPAAASALTGAGDAAELLADLDRRNFFVARHRAAGVGDSYEYHPLFRQFLLEQGRRQLGPDELVAAKREAASLLARDGDVPASIALLRETGDWAELIGLVLRQAPELLRQGRFQTLSAWIGDVPESQRAGVPWLGYFLGVCRLPYDPAQARDLLASAYAGFRDAGNARGEYLAWAGIVDTFVYAWSDFRPADPWIDEFDALRARHPGFPSRDVEVRAVAAIFAMLIYRRPQHPELPAWTARLDALLSQDIDPVVRMTAGSQLVLYYNWWTGNMARANELVRRLEPFASAREIGPFVRLAWEGILAISHWMNADNAAALAAVGRGLALADETGAHVWDFMLMGQGAIAAATSGDLAQARSFLERMQARIAGERRLDGVQYHFFAFQEAAHRGDLNAMPGHAQAGLACAVQAGVVWGEVYTRPALAHALFLAGDEAGAQRELQAAKDLAAQIGCTNAFYYVHELEAQFAEARGDLAAQLAAIAALFAVMREQGFRNSAWWRDDLMARLCRIALENSIEPDFVRALIRLRGLQPDEADVRLERWPWPVRLRALGGFAIELHGEPLRFTGKVQKRPLELLRALIALGGRGVNEAQLTEALWPDAEGDDAHNAFVTTLQRLRKLLGQRDALLLQEGRLGLNPRLCWVDTWAFESVDPDAGDADDLLRALDLYRGGFLANDEAAWAIATRERLRARYVRAAGADARRHVAAGRWEEAIARLERALRVDNTVEAFYQQLMRCHARLGRGAEVASTYRRCHDVLGATLQLRPSPSTDALLKELGGAA